ncbi:glycosyltransferase [Methyloceanibacter sp. wino2]|uniref:glycosyltransferase n=1 Tax=Methyloceanibacter sp. wino2 TaxID=2170729 RepID=UPI000D3E4370|nr:glycosyltransferase [Methyloceanibacter sp. wino2]
MTRLRAALFQRELELTELRAQLDTLSSKAAKQQTYLKDELATLESKLHEARLSPLTWMARTFVARLLYFLARRTSLFPDGYRRRFQLSAAKRDPRRSEINLAAVVADLDAIAVTSLDEKKTAHRQACKAALEEFLSSKRQLEFVVPQAPKVSVVLILYNQAELTLQCLKSLQALDREDLEIIIWDNGSSDDTCRLLKQLDGVNVLFNDSNIHYLRGVNCAASKATGEYLLLLNNDTVVHRNAIRAATNRLDSEPDLGAVGGPILLLDGTLQEAGSIIFHDGSCCGYGRGRSLAEAQFQFSRDVDFCSGAFLMVRRTIWEELGGFDDAFAPAYYEEADLCMRIRKNGFRVAYEPKAVITHVEFGSSASSDEAIALQVRNRHIFFEKHKSTLEADHSNHTDDSHVTTARSGGERRILVIDDSIPDPCLGSGFPRAREMVEAIAVGGWTITFYPMVTPVTDFDSAYAVVPRTVEIAATFGPENLARFLGTRLGFFDAVLVSRPHNMAAYRRALEILPEELQRVPVIYDAEAVFAQREAMRQIEVELRKEIALTKGVETVFAVSSQEAQAFREHGAANVEVLGHSLAPTPLGGNRGLRCNILFVGRLTDDGSPNVHSLEWFVRNVMPKLDVLIGTEWIFKVAGSTGAQSLDRLDTSRVEFLGRVDDLTELYSSSRLFVAPTRFAAGIPLKVQEAASVGLPVVATPILAEQLGWRDGAELLVGDSANDFAEACARLWTDDALWATIRENGLAAIARDCSPTRFYSTVQASLAAVVKP